MALPSPSPRLRWGGPGWGEESRLSLEASVEPYSARPPIPDPYPPHVGGSGQGGGSARSARTILALLLLSCPVAPAALALEAYEISGDAIPRPLGGLVGNSERGAAIVRDRERGNCLICHQGADPAEPFQGSVGPPLRAVGARLDTGQIRLRLVDASRLNPLTVMPPYFRTDDLHNVAPQYRGKPALSAQEIEDVVTYLASLKTP